MKSFPVKRRVVLPVLGLVLFIGGLLFRSYMKEKSGVPALKAEIRELTRRIRLEKEAPPVASDENADLLPTSLSLSRLLSKVQTAAAEADLDSVSFDTRDSEAVSPTPGGIGAGAKAEIRARALLCEVELAGSFASVIKFLGLLETGSPLITIQSLALRPKKGKVGGTVVLVGWWYPGREREVRNG